MRELKLDPKFRGLIDGLLQALERRGCVFVPYQGERDVWEQARLWRRSRTPNQVETAIQFLREQKANFLAGVLEQVGPQQMGIWATNALPGQSWHQWGLAVDCYLEADDGTPIWDGDNPCYATYAKEAEELGLTAGYFWRHKDAVHVQNPHASPLETHDWGTIDREMALRFGG